MLTATQAGKGPFSRLSREAKGLFCYWARDCQLWIAYCVDEEGNQVGDAEYYPNKARLMEAWKI